MPKETADQHGSSAHWLTQRSNGVLSQTDVAEKDSILILDSAVDQRTGGGLAWDTAHRTDNSVK